MKAGLLSKFVGFFRSLITSPSSEVMVVAMLAARDVRSNLGKNLSLVRETTGLDPWVARPIPQIGAIHPQAKRCSTFSLKMPYPHTKRLCLPNGKTWSAACSTQLVGQERSPRDGFIPCASAPEAAGSAAAGALHDQRRGGGEAHCLDKLSCRELICIVFFSILCPFCLKSSKRLNKDIPLADPRLAPNCIYSVMAGQND